MPIPIEELVKRSQHLTGSSRLINSEVFPIQPVATKHSVATPREFGLTGRGLTLDAISQAALRLGLFLGNPYDAVQFVEEGRWDGYTEIAAPGQIGIETRNGLVNRYVAWLRGFGGQHHIDVKLLGHWSDSDHILIVQP